MRSAVSVQINGMNSVTFVQINVMDSQKFVQISVTDSVEAVQISVMDSVRLVQINVTDSAKFHADQGDEFGFCPRRRTCKCQEETGETKSTSRRNRFLALTAIESDDDEEVNAIDTVQEVVEITVGSGEGKSVRPSRKKGVERTKSK